MIYDPVRDAFYREQPCPSWTLNEETCIWEALHPNLKGIIWDEETQNWIEDGNN